MNIQKKILNSIAGWILKKIPAEKPSQANTKNRGTRPAEIEIGDPWDITASAIKDSAAKISGDDDSSERELAECLDKAQRDISKEQDGQQISSTEDKPQPLPERSTNPEALEATFEEKHKPYETKIQAAEDNSIEQEIGIRHGDISINQLAKTNKDATLNELKTSPLISILGLSEDLETRLIESEIYHISDLERSSLDSIKRLLEHDEGLVTELMASLLLKGYVIPTYLEKSKDGIMEIDKDTDRDNELVRVSPSVDTSVTPEYRIPERIVESRMSQWIPKGVSIEIAGSLVTCGLLYVGSSLRTVTGDNDPCLIDPSKEVAFAADYHARLMGYWPSYSKISAEARRAYINWLTKGKKDPSADIGYVFLYFYGLERRIIIDNQLMSDCLTEVDDIVAELRGLLSIYGDRSNSFRRYATGLLDWIAIRFTDDRMYKALSDDQLLDELRPQSISLALGQAARDNVSLPAIVALHWARKEVTGSWTTELANNPSQFTANFKRLYRDEYGDGPIIPCSERDLKLVYNPASSSLRTRSVGEQSIDTCGISDIEIPKGTRRQILGILKQSCLDPKFIRESGAGDLSTLDGASNAIALPNAELSDATLKGIDALIEQALAGPVAMKMESLIDKLDMTSTDNRVEFKSISERLQRYSLFILPDVTAGSAVPGLIDDVVIYIAKPLTQSSQQSPKFRAANMALQLASAVAASDGEFSDSEHKHLLGRVKDWSHLGDNQIIHLEAYLYYLRITPLKLNAVKLNQIKKRIRLLDLGSTRLIAQFIASVAQADGKILPGEMQMLERIYKLLDLDTSLIYSDLHEDAISATSPSSILVTEAKSSSADKLELDTTKIAQLQKETDQGYELLASIFSEEDNEEPTADAAKLINETESSERTDQSLVLGLDSRLSMFLCQLMERPSWSRSEVVVLASELGLMTDGALESINEASYDKLDLPFAEGDDPVEINPDAIRRLRS
jgi:hypothetical protein